MAGRSRADPVNHRFGTRVVELVMDDVILSANRHDVLDVQENQVWNDGMEVLVGWDSVKLGF